MRVLIAPDKFKGSLSASDAASAIARGFQKAMPRAAIHQLPIADGGEGTSDAICAALGGEWICVPASNPRGEIVEARYAWIEKTKLAVIEMSAASGLWRVPAEKRNPLLASTRGTGELIADAIARGAREIIVGLGGSATNDGGAGMAEALGFIFLTSDGDPIEAIPKNLLALERIAAPENFSPPPIIAACDVRNPLLGEHGATRVYGAQKGAPPEMLPTLEHALENLADVCARDLGCDFRSVPGAGAAGGLGFGLLTFCGAKICSGFDVVAGILDLENAIAASDLVVTGEGRLDEQTLHGKGPAGVAALAKKHHKAVIAFGGSIASGAPLREIFDRVFPLSDEPIPLEQSIRDAASLLESAAERAASSLSVNANFSTAPRR